jgi:hypothetical protein
VPTDTAGLHFLRGDHRIFAVPIVRRIGAHRFDHLVRQSGRRPSRA